jgi:hypothetical protein
MAPRCDHCPVAGSATPCRAQTTGHRRYCELVDPTGPHYHPGYAERLLRPEAAPVVAQVDPELRQEAEACPHRLKKPCGGCATVCGPAGRRAAQVVTLQQCLECVKAASSPVA